ncbi:MAG: penicillin-binding protein 2 [Paludibacteraceae bacterium]|jgi:cell division protein FtsI (penicillin-binding protein 3)|nr:penicillin-binding protein 2 [Paludibacteraceae bacterium]
MLDEQKNTVWRFAIIFILISLGFLAVLGKIIYIQTVERSEWMKVAEKQVPTHRPIKATRGNILDCNGQLLASSMPQYYIYMDTRADALVINNSQLLKEHLDSLCHDLTSIIGDYTTEEYRQRIVQGQKQGNRRLKLSKGRINYLQRRALEQNSLIRLGKYKSGVFFEDQHRRIKPYGLLASRTIGSINGEEGIGTAGLEKAFDKELHGVDGISSLQRIGGRNESVTIEEAQDGMDIITTIDANLQDITENALLTKLKEKNAQWGCCILMETHTGYIRAIANLDRGSDGEYYESLNHAVQRVEPGSTFKTISLVAAMDDGKIEIDDTISVTKKPWVYMRKSKHTDAHPMDTILDVRSALAVSSNIALAKLITSSYEGSARKFVRKIERMGLCDSIYCEIPGAEQARIDIPKDTVTLSKMSYGYSVEMSPMHIAMFYNAIANNGKMMRPMLVSAIQKEGEIVKRFKPTTLNSSICSRSTLREIQGALHDVVWDEHLGTASKRPWSNKAQSNLVALAGKTGTAQLYIPGKGYSNRKHRITFVGYFPEANPEYTCICMIENPQYPYDAGMDCGSTVRVIAEKTMAHCGYYVWEDDEKRLEKR